METYHRLAEERCLFGVLSQPVENGHAQGLFQPGSSGLDRLKQAFPPARYPRTRQRQDRRPSCASGTGLQRLTERRQGEFGCSVFYDESEVCECPHEATEGRRMGLRGRCEFVSALRSSSQMVG